MKRKCSSYKEMKGEGIPNIVIPTIRNEAFFEVFLQRWQQEFEGCHVIIVEDRPKKLLEKIVKRYLNNYTIYDWKDIDKDLKKDSWIIPRQTDCVRSYGYLKAYQQNPLFVVTLDDDVYPSVPGHIKTFYKHLFQQEYEDNKFYNTLRNHQVPRGTYKYQFGCDMVHGGWLSVPDLSAEEQIKNDFLSKLSNFNIGLIPKGALASICGMNLAWKPEVTKYLYFGLQGKNYPIDRCGDIWAGYYALHNEVVTYTGYPFVIHNKASNVWNNLKKETNAEEMSYNFRVYLEDKDDFLVSNNYFIKLDEAYKVWERLLK